MISRLDLLRAYLHRVIELNRADLLRHLLDILGPNIVRLKNKNNGYTPLHTACLHNRGESHEETITILVEKGADVNDANNMKKFSPLHLLVNNGTKKIINIVWKADANADSKDSYGRSPIYYGLSNNNLDAIEVLNDYSVDLTCQDFEGNTPLHWAAMFCNMRVYDLLTDNDEDCREILNSFGFLPASLGIVYKSSRNLLSFYDLTSLFEDIGDDFLAQEDITYFCRKIGPKIIRNCLNILINENKQLTDRLIRLIFNLPVQHIVYYEQAVKLVFSKQVVENPNFFLPNYVKVDPELKKELAMIARTIVAPGKGILDTNMSAATIGKRLDQLGVENNAKNRETYRQLLDEAKEVN